MVNFIFLSWHLSYIPKRSPNRGGADAKPRNILYKTPFAHAFEPKHLSTGSLAYIVGLNLLIFRIFAP
jgi:uncharacterized membrane protein